MAPRGQGDASYGTSAVPLQHHLRDHAAGIPMASVFLEPRLNRKTTLTCTTTCTRPRHRDVEPAADMIHRPKPSSFPARDVSTS